MGFYRTDEAILTREPTAIAPVATDTNTPNYLPIESPVKMPSRMPNEKCPVNDGSDTSSISGITCYISVAEQGSYTGSFSNATINLYCAFLSNPINFVDPDGLSGRLIIISSEGNNQVGSVNFGNHSLLAFLPDDSDTTYTWGTWGREDIGIVGLVENYEGDRNYLESDCPKVKRRSLWISDAQQMELEKLVSRYFKKGKNAWSKWSACSSFASTVWNNVTGESLQDRHLQGLGYSDPNILANSINNANRGASR